MEGEST